jgi:hypothetical protein
MEGAGQALVLSIYIKAIDQFSGMMERLGLAGMKNAGIFQTLQMGAVGVAAGLIAIGVAANHYASEFQTQFARITGLTGSSQQQIDYYRNSLIQMSAQYDMTAADAAKALYFIISAGLDPLGTAMQQAHNNMDVLRYSSMSATASLADQANVADAMTSMMKA